MLCCTIHTYGRGRNFSEVVLVECETKQVQGLPFVTRWKGLKL